MKTVRWGILGCGSVTEKKSGPGFQKAEDSDLVAVMRRDAKQAADYAHRHGVARSYNKVEDLISDPNVDAIYIATPPSSHYPLALKVAETGKPCLVEKPMAKTYEECRKMVETFEVQGIPLFVAYYRRALPRFLKVREMVKKGELGTLSSVHIVHYGSLASNEQTTGWRFDPEISGGGLFMDLASHGLDILDFLISPICKVSGFSVNTGGAYLAEDVTTACFEFISGIVGTGVWNFNADHSEDRITFTGSKGELHCPIFSDTDIVLKKLGTEEIIPFKNPPHVHQPLIQTIVDHLLGRGICQSTGESAARTGKVMDQCLKTYYQKQYTIGKPII